MSPGLVIPVCVGIPIVRVKRREVSLARRGEPEVTLPVTGAVVKVRVFASLVFQ